MPSEQIKKAFHILVISSAGVEVYLDFLASDENQAKATAARFKCGNNRCVKLFPPEGSGSPPIAVFDDSVNVARTPPTDRPA